jgi:hypothetical protein
MTKTAGSGSISQRHGSADPDPDPPQNVMDPQHWILVNMLCAIDCSFELRGILSFFFLFPQAHRFGVHCRARLSPRARRRLLCSRGCDVRGSTRRHPPGRRRLVSGRQPSHRRRPATRFSCDNCWQQQRKWSREYEWGFLRGNCRV